MQPTSYTRFQEAETCKQRGNVIFYCDAWKQTRNWTPTRKGSSPSAIKFSLNEHLHNFLLILLVTNNASKVIGNVH